MTTDDTGQQPVEEPEPSVEEIEADIERTRAELGQTVSALHAKLDVRTRTKDKASELSGRARAAVTDESGAPRRDVLAGAAGAVLVLSLLVAWRVRSRRAAARRVQPDPVAAAADQLRQARAEARAAADRVRGAAARRGA